MRQTSFYILILCVAGFAGHAQVKDIPFGANGHILFRSDKGTYEVAAGERRLIKDAFALGRIKQRTDSSSSYTARRWSEEVFKGGRRYIAHLSAPDRPAMQLVFTIYAGKDYFLCQARVKADASDYISPMTSRAVQVNAGRALFVPFDNDAWVRYRAVSLDSADFTSSEVSVLYNDSSGQGLVIGSVAHTVWKSGVRVRGGGADLAVFSGYTDEKYTHDKMGHGAVKADADGFCSGAPIFVGWGRSWKDVMEEYGRANVTTEPRYVEKTRAVTPFGWNSWGAMQDKISLEKVKQVADFFYDSCKIFRSGGTLYIDLDSYWDKLLKGGLEGDYSQLKEFCDYCLKKGFQPGIYWAPFVDWGKSARRMEGSSYNYADCWLRQHGELVDLDGARALDPTHPGTRARIGTVIGHFKDCGFKMIKVDFLGHATLEADKFYDTAVTTGMQAFRRGMEYLIDELDGKMLVYAAISPNLATARYAHMRRIACDAYSDISETEYTLNSTTYGWWQQEMYDWLDADHVVFRSGPAGVNRARLASALVTGTLMVGDDFSLPGPWRETARRLLNDRGMLALAGRSFRPGGREGVFEAPGVIVVFNFGTTPIKYRNITVPPADAVILRLD